MGRGGGTDWTIPLDHLKLDHLLNNVKGKEHLFVFMMSQPVDSMIEAQRTAHLRAASLHLGDNFCYICSENVLWDAKEGAVLGRRHSCRFVWSPAVTEDFP